MARKPNVDVLSRYQGELVRSRNYRKNGDREGLWTRMVSLYEGNHHTGEGASDRMVVNRAFKTKNVISPSVALRNPKFMVKAQSSEHAAQALLTTDILNYVWQSNRYKKEFRLAVDDDLVVGHGWLKVGYKFAKPVVVKPTSEDRALDASTEPGIDDREDREGNVEHEKYDADTERAFVERISMFDMFVDPDARHLGEARWIAQRVRRPVADVKVDSRYVPGHRKMASTMSQDQWSDDRDEVPGTNGSSKGFCEVWEFYDLRENTVCTILGGYAKGFLIAPQPMPYAFGHPFIMLRNYEVADKFYPMGELESIEALQQELNKTRTEQMEHRRGNQRKYLAMEDALDSDGWEALQSNTDGEIVKVRSQYSIGEAVQLMPTHTISGDAYNMSGIIDADIDDITGVTDYAQTSIRRTATEAAMIQDQSNARSADKLSKIEDSLAEVGERLIQLMQQYMTGKQVARIIGGGQAPIWLEYDKHMIQGRFDFEVEGGSTQPMNESSRRQAALQFSDAMIPFIDREIVDPMPVAIKLLEDFGVKNPTIFLAKAEEELPMEMEDPMMGDEMGAMGMPPGMGGLPSMGPDIPPGPSFGAMADPMAMEDDIAAVDGIPPELMALLNIEAQPSQQF